MGWTIPSIIIIIKKVRLVDPVCMPVSYLPKESLLQGWGSPMQQPSAKGASLHISEPVCHLHTFCPSFWKEKLRWCLHKAFFPPLFEQAAIWLLQLKSVFLSVSALVSGALDWALSVCEHGERLCIKAVGQDKRQYDSRMADGKGIGGCSLLGWRGNVSSVLWKMWVWWSFGGVKR